MEQLSPTDSYYAFFSQLTDYAPISMLSLFFLALCRLAPVIAVAPFFGSKVPSGIKMGLLVAITVVMLPHIVMTSQTAIDFDTLYIALLMKELFVGVVLAVFISLPFYIAQSSGVLIDFQRGASSLQVSDPFTQTQASDIGILYNYMMIVAFYQLDGPLYFFDALLTSYEVVPADGWIHAAFFQFHHPFWVMVWGLLAQMFAIGIQLAAPCLLAILMTELFLGIANRLAPQVQIAFLGMSLKSLAGLAVLWLSWFFILKQIGVQALLWLKQFHQILYTISG